MRTLKMKRSPTLLVYATCGFVMLLSVGCRTFEPVDSFFAHLDRFKPAFEESFREECGQPDASECKFFWGLDCLYIKQQPEDLLTPYRADCVSVSVRGPDGRSAFRKLGWTYRQRDGKWHENGFGRWDAQQDSKPSPCDIDVLELVDRVNKELIQ